MDMGERAGYRARQGRITSPILRKQWFIGDSEEELKDLVGKVALKLVEDAWGDPVINGGGVALRDDLDIGRLTAALYAALYEPPFDSIEFTVDCDIEDHGLYEIELVRWNLWSFNHYKVSGKWVGPREILFAVKFIPYRTLSEGTVWLSKEEFVAELIKPDQPEQ